MGKVMRHTLGASLNIRHNLSSSKGPKPLQLKLLTTYIPKTSAFTLAFSTSQRLRTTRASARTFFTFRHYFEGFPFIQEPPSGDLQERVLIRHHDYDQCFQSVQLLQWNSQVKFNVTVYRNLPTTRDSIMTS